MEVRGHSLFLNTLLLHIEFLVVLVGIVGKSLALAGSFALGARLRGRVATRVGTAGRSIVGARCGVLGSDDLLEALSTGRS